jgi:hypothetical protein
MTDDRAQEKMISIWSWVGMILTTYGVLICGSGVYYIFRPPAIVLAELNPSLWWGAVMLLAGVFFLLIPKYALKD